MTWSLELVALAHARMRLLDYEWEVGRSCGAASAAMRFSKPEISASALVIAMRALRRRVSACCSSNLRRRSSFDESVAKGKVVSVVDGFSVFFWVMIGRRRW